MNIEICILKCAPNLFNMYTGKKIASPLCTVMMYFWYGPSEQPRVVIILKASMDKPQET